jgi:heme/copper-type cytochrome/quinol oxidase subunit 2
MTTRSKIRRIFVWSAMWSAVWIAATSALVGPPRANAQARVIEVTADSDSRYKIAGQRTPEIVVKAGEQVLLRVTAHKGKSWNRDGSIHGFSLLRVKDRSRVDGWDLLFKPGKQEFLLTVPNEPGAYEVVCTVICSEEHEGMHMMFTVLP